MYRRSRLSRSQSHGTSQSIGRNHRTSTMCITNLINPSINNTTSINQNTDQINPNINQGIKPPRPFTMHLKQGPGRPDQPTTSSSPLLPYPQRTCRWTHRNAFQLSICKHPCSVSFLDM